MDATPREGSRLSPGTRKTVNFIVYQSSWLAGVVAAAHGQAALGCLAVVAAIGLHLWLASPHAPMRRYNAAVPMGVPAREPFLAADMVFFDGAGAQRVYVSAKEKLVIVREGAGTLQWDDAALPNLVVAAARSCR